MSNAENTQILKILYVSEEIKILTRKNTFHIFHQLLETKKGF